MKFVDRSQMPAIFLTISLFVAFMSIQVGLADRLYGFQPYVQQFFADYGEPDELFTQRVEIYSGDFVVSNTSLLRTTSYVVSEGGTLDSSLLFLFGGIFLRALYALLVMMIMIAMEHKVQYALVLGLVIFTSPFFVFGSTPLVPANVAILFFLLMIWGFEKYKRTGRIVFMLVVILSMLGNILYDPTSVVINAIIVLSYGLVFLFNEDPRKIEVTFTSTLIALILLLPIFATLLNIVSTSLGTFGDNSIWAQYIGADLQPTVNTFFEIVGYPVMIFSVLGVVAVVRWQWRRYLHLLVMLACVLLLMLNITPRLTINPARMQAYLYFVLILISGVYISLLFTRTSRLVRMMLIAVFVSYGIAVMLTTPPFERLTDDELALATTINQLLQDNPNDIVYVETEAMALAVLIDHPAQLCAYWEPVFQFYVPPESGDVPDCTIAEYRLAETGRTLSDYRIVTQTDTVSIYQRIVDA